MEIADLLPMEIRANSLVVQVSKTSNRRFAILSVNHSDESKDIITQLCVTLYDDQGKAPRVLGHVVHPAKIATTQDLKMFLNVALADVGNTFTIVGAQHNGFDLNTMLITFTADSKNEWVLAGEHWHLSPEAAIKAHFFSDGNPKVVDMKPIYFMSSDGRSGMYTDIYGNDRVYQMIGDKWLGSYTRNHSDIVLH